MNRPLYFLLLVACSVFPATSTSQVAVSRPIVVSMIQLIANPEKFDGKSIAVVGFLGLEYEANLLYLNMGDYDNVEVANALWIDTTEEIRKNREHLNLFYVRIEGTFRAGHGNKRSEFLVGGITDIKKCTFYSDPAHPLIERIKNAMHP